MVQTLDRSCSEWREENSIMVGGPNSHLQLLTPITSDPPGARAQQLTITNVNRGLCLFDDRMARSSIAIIGHEA